MVVNFSDAYFVYLLLINSFNMSDRHNQAETEGLLLIFFIFYITYKNHYLIILQSVDSCFQIIFKIKFATHNKYVSHVMFLTSKLQVWKWIIKTFIYKMFPFQILFSILCSGRIKLVYPKVHCMLFIILQGWMMGKTQNLFFLINVVFLSLRSELHTCFKI